jgi:acyl carrier protein
VLRSEHLVQDALVQVGVAVEKVRMQADLRDELEVDSSELIEVCAVIADMSGIRLTAKDVSSVSTVADLAAAVEMAAVPPEIPIDSRGDGDAGLH